MRPGLTSLSLIDEIFTEAFPEKETVVLEISVPRIKNESEFHFESELDAIGKRLQQCLSKMQIPGIRSTTVTRSKDSEIILEFETVTINRRRGNLYRDRIGDVLKNCSSLFRAVKVEGAPNVNNRFDTKPGPRYVDIRLLDISSGKPVNIEVKRGGSRYHSLQKQKDTAIENTLKQGQTYVMRGTPKRRR
jgi:hypothetical protein